jgi:hypothetical protein
MVSADRDEIRAAVAARYAGLARAVQAGQAVTDGDPDACPDGGCSAPGYPDTAGLPEAAVRASLGCGNPVTVATCAQVRRRWTWAPVAVSTCCCPAAGSARKAKRTAWT